MILRKKIYRELIYILPVILMQKNYRYISLEFGFLFFHFGFGYEKLHSNSKKNYKIIILPSLIYWFDDKVLSFNFLRYKKNFYIKSKA